MSGHHKSGGGETPREQAEDATAIHRKIVGAVTEDDDEPRRRVSSMRRGSDGQEKSRCAGSGRYGAAREDLSAVADADLSADISPTVRSRSKRTKPAENRPSGAGIAVAKATAMARPINSINRQTRPSRTALGLPKIPTRGSKTAP
jgi:hypothetical protein